MKEYHYKPDMSSFRNAKNWSNLIDINWNDKKLVLVDPFYQFAYWIERGRSALAKGYSIYSSIPALLALEEDFFISILDFIRHLILNLGFSIGRKAIAVGEKTSFSFEPLEATLDHHFDTSDLFSLFK